RSTRPAACNAAAPAIATATASSHIRSRRESPKLTQSLIAPIVQKFTRVATAPKIAARTNAEPVTSTARWLTSGIGKLWHGGTRRPARGGLTPFRYRQRL